MKIWNFFDRLEDKIRQRLSKHPILYALISGIAVVLFFRGVWMVADQFSFMTAWVTLAISIFVLLMTGVFVYHFISEQVLISGLKKEKKLVEKTAAEVQSEAVTLREIKEEIEKLKVQLAELKNSPFPPKKALENLPPETRSPDPGDRGF